MDCCEIWDFTGNPKSGPHYWYFSTLDSSCRMLRAEMKVSVVENCRQLSCYENKDEDFLHRQQWNTGSLYYTNKALVQEIWSQSFPCMEKGWKEYFCGLYLSQMMNWKGLSGSGWRIKIVEVFSVGFKKLVYYWQRYSMITWKIRLGH